MADAPHLDLRTGPQRVFLHVLLNTLVVSVTNFTLWFAITFWVFLETRSVFATGMIGGIFLVFTTLTGIWLGSLVDHHPKKTVLQASAAVSLVLYAASLAVYLLSPAEAFRRTDSVWLWVFVLLLMLGVIAGNVRMIALSTLVTLLVPADVRDRANGLVGTTAGVSFLVTSVISGLLVAAGGMLYALLLALVVLVAALAHLSRVVIPGTGGAGARPPSTGTTPSRSRSCRAACWTGASTCAAPSGWSAASRDCWPSSASPASTTCWAGSSWPCSTPTGCP